MVHIHNLICIESSPDTQVWNEFLTWMTMTIEYDQWPYATTININKHTKSMKESKRNNSHTWVTIFNLHIPIQTNMFTYKHVLHCPDIHSHITTHSQHTKFTLAMSTSNSCDTPYLFVWSCLILFSVLFKIIIFMY